MPTDEASAAQRTGAQAVDRALAVLDCFRHGAGLLGVTELARMTGLNVSTTHRLVRALVARGFLEQDPASERYRLGVIVAVLGGRARLESGYRLALPVLQQLAADTSEAVSLGVRRNDEVVVVERIAAAHPLRFDHPDGAEIHLHASAMGKALLAWESATGPGDVSSLDLVRYTPATILSADALAAELAAVRERGYATNEGERYEGVSGLAVPVLGPTGNAVAAVGVQGPSSRFTSARIAELAPRVQVAAAQAASLLAAL